MVEKRIGEKWLRLVRDDITDLEIDAFVFDITEDAKLGSGFGSAIQQRGGIKIQKELDEIGRVPKGEAVVTKAGLLKADHIIHTNGPKFREPDERDKLRRATKSALARAEELGIKRIAFPSIGTGLYQVAIDLCAEVMIDTITEHLGNGSDLDEVLLVIPDTREYGPFAAKMQEGV
jgi:O-acetyl-ADP-ribose deacetylase (regulator of RNase III)